MGKPLKVTPQKRTAKSKMPGIRLIPPPVNGVPPTQIPSPRDNAQVKAFCDLLVTILRREMKK